MILQDLTLHNFRSYTKKAFAFSPKTTVIVGPNTAGKTNILEAIAFLATGKSFRADVDREAIAWESDFGRVIAHVGTATAEVANKNLDPSSVSLAELVPTIAAKGSRSQSEVGQNFIRSPQPRDEQTTLEIVLTTGEVNGTHAPMKKYLVNGVARRMVDFVGTLRAVLFWPEHLELVTDSPSIRRKYLDSVLVQVDREYRRNLSSYERGLRQRNRLLDLINEGKAGRGQLLFWNQLLIKAGGYITEKRFEFINYINSRQSSAVPAKQDLASLDSYQIQYDKSVISESRLEQYAVEEVGAKATLVGPHRDDFLIQGKRKKEKGKSEEGDSYLNLSKYGSRGEQRLAVLWMKLAELEYIENQTGERPIFLLDDIFSELDEGHRRLVVDLVGRQQTILTSADEASVPKKILGEAMVIRI